MNAPLTIPAPRVILATKFPEKFIRDTVEPGLRDLGCDVVRIVGTKWDGEIKDCDAVAFMFDMCSHHEHDAFKRRAKASGVQFMLLSRKRSEWASAFRTAGIALPPRVPSVIVGDGKPLIPPPPRIVPVEEIKEEKPMSVEEPKPSTFGAALRAARTAEGISQLSLARLCGISDGMPWQWEKQEMPVAEDCYHKLLDLFPALKDAPKPKIARGHSRPALRQEASKEAKPKPPAVTRQGAEKLVGVLDHLMAASVKEPPAKPVRAAPTLAGLRLAARVLRIGGPVVVTIDDATTAVQIGEERWGYADPDSAIAAASAALDERLRGMLAEIEAARASLGGET